MCSMIQTNCPDASEILHASHAAGTWNHNSLARKTLRYTRLVLKKAILSRLQSHDTTTRQMEQYGSKFPSAGSARRSNFVKADQVIARYPPLWGRLDAIQWAVGAAMTLSSASLVQPAMGSSRRAALLRSCGGRLRCYPLTEPVNAEM